MRCLPRIDGEIPPKLGRRQPRRHPVPPETSHSVHLLVDAIIAIMKERTSHAKSFISFHFYFYFHFSMIVDSSSSALSAIWGIMWVSQSNVTLIHSLSSVSAEPQSYTQNACDPRKFITPFPLPSRLPPRIKRSCHSVFVRNVGLSSASYQYCRRKHRLLYVL